MILYRGGAPPEKSKFVEAVLNLNKFSPVCDFTLAVGKASFTFAPFSRIRSTWKRRLWKFAFFVALPGSLLLTLLGGIAFWWAYSQVDIPHALHRQTVESYEILDRHGRPLRSLLTEKETYHQWTAREDIPDVLIQATLSAEDKRFYDHPGVDLLAVSRAVFDAVRHREVGSGASTITQQLIKTAEPRPRTFRNKAIEALKALKLENQVTKDGILEQYLNRVSYGRLRLGCEAAARFYFDKPVSDLSLAEAAFLAGLPKAPTELDPHRNFEGAKERQGWVLKRMEDNGFITSRERQRALTQDLRLAHPENVFRAPHFVDLLLRLHSIDGQDTDHPTTAMPSRVMTTLDGDLQRHVELRLQSRLDGLREFDVQHGAAVVIDNRTGEVLALAGSLDYHDKESHGQVNGAWALRSPGSALKPFTYGLAFENGHTAADIVPDVPTEFATSTGIYTPVNYDRRHYGPTRYRLALANSLNIAAIRVLEAAGGTEALQRRLETFGLTTLEEESQHYGLGLTIGNAEVRLLELTNAYAALARLGEYRPYILVPDSPLTRSQPSAEENARLRESLPPSPGACWLVADILSDNAARTLAFGSNSWLKFDFPVACKTGTSSDWRDNWAFGFTPEFTVGIWVGNFDGSPMKQVSGVSGAAPVLHDVLTYLHDYFGTTWYERPAGIVEREINPINGKALNEDDPIWKGDTVTEVFLPGALPETEKPEDYVGGRVLLGAEYAEWFKSGENWLRQLAMVDDSSAQARLKIISPLPGSTYYLDPDLTGSGSRLPLRLNLPLTTQRWHSDTLQILASSVEPIPAGEADSSAGEDGAEAAFPELAPFISRDDDQTTPVAILKPGRHEIKALDPETGETASTWIQVDEL